MFYARAGVDVTPHGAEPGRRRFLTFGRVGDLRRLGGTSLEGIHERTRINRQARPDTRRTGARATVGFTSVGIGSAAASADVTPRGVVGVSDLGKITSTVKGKTSTGDASAARSRRSRSSSATARCTSRASCAESSRTPAPTRASRACEHPDHEDPRLIADQRPRGVLGCRRATSSTWSSARSTSNILGLRISLNRVVLDITAVARCRQPARQPAVCRCSGCSTAARSPVCSASCRPCSTSPGAPAPGRLS